VTDQQSLVLQETGKAICAILMAHSPHFPEGFVRQVLYRVSERVHGEVYRREREHYPEWIDHGGQG